MVLLLVRLLRERRVDVLEDFGVDDIERHGQARRLVGQVRAGNNHGDLAGVPLERPMYSCPWVKTGPGK